MTTTVQLPGREQQPTRFRGRSGVDCLSNGSTSAGCSSEAPKEEIVAVDQSRIGHPMRVAVVDDDADTRLYFKDVVSSAEGFEFAGDFPNGAEALNGIPRLLPVLVLMDIRMPNLNGLDCMKRLKQMLACLKIIIVTGIFDADLAESSLRAGADGCLIKPVTAEQCLATLKFVGASPMEMIPQRVTPEYCSGAASGMCPLLSPRENAVMTGLADGLLYKEIADKLGISYSTVHRHQERLFRKLHAGNCREAIRLWRQGGIE